MDLVWVIFLFLLGACVGSFLNVVIYRVPRGESIVFPGSHCPRCGTFIKWYDNLPLLSWLVLRARCRACKGHISARYFLIELLTACLVAGLYVCYFVLRLRRGAGAFPDEWPMFVAHAVLLCTLLAASAVDIELFVVPLSVMWVCMFAGVACAAIGPHPFMPPAKPVGAAVAVAVLLGLLIGKLLLRLGWLQPSFIDADDKPILPAAEGKRRPEQSPDTDKAASKGPAARPRDVGMTAADGVNPRIEMLRELAFLAPAGVLGAAAWLLVSRVPAARGFMEGLLGQAPSSAQAFTALGPHIASALGAVLGALVGAAWIWGARIIFTLVLGREAMGMGDVYILAGVGAAAGWGVASLAFFAAPFFGLLWVLLLAIFSRARRELPYGPWLATGALAVLLLYDALTEFLSPLGR